MPTGLGQDDVLPDQSEFPSVIRLCTQAVGQGLGDK